MAAHSDNIKKVSYLNDGHTILSASSDGTVKLWDLRNTSASLGSMTMQNPVEDFCLRNSSQLVVTHGNALSIAEINLGSNSLEEKQSFFPF